jgi:mevalonate kinase
MNALGHACGKVILLGEHAVVYGIPAIAVGIDRGARATAAPMERGPSRLFVRGWDIDVHEN